MKRFIAASLLSAAFGLAQAQTAAELLADSKNTDDVLTFGLGYDLTM